MHVCHGAQVYSVQLGSWKWTEHTSEVDGDVPAPRSGHTAVALPDGRHLAVFGGGDADKDLFFSSVSILDTATWRWSTPKIQAIYPQGSAPLCLPPQSTHLLSSSLTRDIFHGGITIEARLQISWKVIQEIQESQEKRVGLLGVACMVCVCGGWGGGCASLGWLCHDVSRFVMMSHGF